MTDEKAILSKLFLDLKTWRDTEDKNTDALSLICLQIISVLIDDPRVHKFIALPLSLIVPKRAVQSVDDLFLNLQRIDNDLESHLRGFSRLLESVLETNTIKNDPVVLLQSLSDVDEKTLLIFKNIIPAITAYFDLDDVFNLNSSRVMPTAFLIALCSLYETLTKDEYLDSYQEMRSFVSRRVTDKKIAFLFEQFFTRPPFYPIEDVAKEFFLLSLCFRVARYEPLNEEESFTLDSLLKDFGLVGLDPLLEAGFLFLKEPLLHTNSKDNNQKILKLNVGNA